MRAWEGVGGGVKKVHEEILEDNVYVHYTLIVVMVSWVYAHVKKCTKCMRTL